MSAAEVKETKTSLIAWIEQLSDLEMLSMLESVKNSNQQKDWWDTLTPAQIDNINAGVRDAENGNVMTSEEFWARLKNA